MKQRAKEEEENMASNEEKAQCMPNMFIALKAEEEEKKPKEWFYLRADWRDLPHVDKLHKQLMREIGCKVAEIQNEGLGEHSLRDLNREINNLLFEKTFIERRLVGSEYSRHSYKMIDLDGNIVDLPNPGIRCPILGYGYFGAAAKKLPEALELLEKPPQLRKRPTRYDIYKIDASCYGQRDEEDGVLERAQVPPEKMRREVEEMRREAVEMRREAAEMRREAAEEMRREAAEEMKKMRCEVEEMRRGGGYEDAVPGGGDAAASEDK